MADIAQDANVNLDLLKSFFENEKYRQHIAELLRNLELKDKVLQEEMSSAFVRRALAEESFPDESLESTAELQTQALILAGMNTKGVSLVSEELQRQTFEEILPRALKNPENGLINSSVAQGIIGYMAHEQDTPFFSPKADSLLSDLLSDEIKASLLQRVADKALTSPLGDEGTRELLQKHNVAPSQVREAANDPVAVQDATPEGQAPQGSQPNSNEVGNASDEFKYPDAGEFADNAYREAEKHRLSIDNRAEARDRINAILKEKPGWVERTVLDRIRAKKDQFLQDLDDGALFVKDPLKYPKESIFSETLSEVDETGRQVNEMVVMKNTPLSTKAIFKSPDAPKEAYEISALRLREQGVRRPYLDATYKDRDKCMQFLMQSTEALLKAGYDINDIVVAPRVKHLFGPIYELHNQHGILSEAPEDLAADPDDPAMEKKYGLEEEDKGPARPSGNEEVHEKIRALHEPLDAVINMYDNGDEGVEQSIRDLSPEVLSSAMSVADFIDDDASWQRAVDEGGLNPRSNEFLKRLVGDFKSMVADVANKPPSDVGAKAAELILACDSSMTKIYKDDPEGLNQARQAYKNAMARNKPESELSQAAGNNAPSQSFENAVDSPSNENLEMHNERDDDVDVNLDYAGGEQENEVDSERSFDELNLMLQEASERDDMNGFDGDVPPNGSEAPPGGDDMSQSVSSEPDFGEVPPPNIDDMSQSASPEPDFGESPPPNIDDMSQSASPEPDFGESPPPSIDDMSQSVSSEPDFGEAPPPNIDDMSQSVSSEPDFGESPPPNIDDMSQSVSSEPDFGEAPPPNIDDMSQVATSQSNFAEASSVGAEGSDDPEIDLNGFSEPSEDRVSEDVQEKEKMALVTDFDREMIASFAKLGDGGFTQNESKYFDYVKGIARSSAHQEQIMLCAEEMFDGSTYASVRRNLRDCFVALDDVMIDIDGFKENENIQSIWRVCDAELLPNDCRDAILEQVSPDASIKNEGGSDNSYTPPKR